MLLGHVPRAVVDGRSAHVQASGRASASGGRMAARVWLRLSGSLGLTVGKAG